MDSNAGTDYPTRRWGRCPGASQLRGPLKFDREDDQLRILSADFSLLT